MATTEHDPWKFSTGLPDDFDGMIEDAYFMYDPEYNNGQTLLLKLEVKADDAEVAEMLQRPLQYPLGNGFTPIEGGAAVEREDGSKKGYHVNSGIATLLKAMLDCKGAQPVIQGPGRNNPFRAELFIGTNWHWESKTFHYGGEIGDKDRLLPTSFLGVKGQGAGAATGAVKKAAPAKAAAPAAKAPAKAQGAVKKASPAMAPPVEELPSEAPAATEGLEEGSEAWTQLWDIAMAADSHQQFVEQAFELEGVADNEAVAQAVLDDGADSLWGKAVAAYEAANA
jgi:hypothetical protein